ncbi:MAG TPA: hypothetical protein VKB45_18535 [Gemmatimonadales bacterium]|nr:hypothetical protein [Gemmatimonadales bacterium]
MTSAARSALIVGLLVLAGRALALNRALIGVSYDDGLYAGAAIALAHGQGYVHPHLPGTPAVVHYPPVYPLVLAPFFGTMSVDAAGFASKLLNVIIAAITAALIAWHAARSELLGPAAPRWLAPAVVTAAALAIPCLVLQTALYAEPLFGLWLALAVVIADAPTNPGSAVRGAVLSGLAAALALLTRTIGVAAGAGVAGFLLVVRKVPLRHAALAALPVAVAAIGWGWWTTAHARGIDPAMAINYGSYAEVVKQSGLSAWTRSIPDLVRPVGTITLAWVGSRLLYLVFGIAALLVGAYGWWLAWRRSAIGFTLVGYFAILAVWPFDPDRFEWAVLPWIALIWTAGAVRLYQQDRRLHIPVGLMAAAIVVGYLIQESTGLAHRGWRNAYVQANGAFHEMLPTLTALPADAVLASDGEALVWLYTRHPTVPFYVYGYHDGQWVQPTPAVQRAYLERMGVTHVLLTGFGGGSDQELNALLGAYPGWLTAVHVWPGGKALFQVRR